MPTLRQAYQNTRPDEEGYVDDFSMPYDATLPEDEFAPTGGYVPVGVEQAPSVTGGTSPIGTGWKVDPVTGSLTSGDYTIYNPQYAQPSSPANSGVNNPFSNYTPYGVAKTGTTTTGGQARGSITQGSTPYATVQTQQTVAPGAAPEFKAPEYDEGAIKSKTRTIAAAGLRRLRMALSGALSKAYENPNVRRMVLREALAGYGIGVAGVMGQATQAAGAEYSREYAQQYQTAVQNYNAAWNSYRASATTISRSQPVYSQAEYDKLIKEAQTLSL
jgi:hypothetical protein